MDPNHLARALADLRFFLGHPPAQINQSLDLEGIAHWRSAIECL